MSRDGQYRLLYASISTSRRIRNVKKKMVQGDKWWRIAVHLLYSWIILVEDDERRLPGDSVWIMANAVRYEEFTIEEIEEMLAELHRVKLILWYEVNGDKFIQIVEKRDMQRIRNDRFKKSIYPPPPKEMLENALKEENGTNSNGSESAADPQPNDGESAANPQPNDGENMGCAPQIRDLSLSLSLSPTLSLSLSSPAEKKEIKGDHELFMEFYFEEFKKRFGNTPIIEKGKDGAHVKFLLRKINIDELKNLLLKFFDSENKFIQDSGYTLGIFRSQIQRFRVKSKTKSSGIDKATQKLKEAIHGKQKSIEHQSG